jgi:hypothetical protein
MVNRNPTTCNFRSFTVRSYASQCHPISEPLSASIQPGSQSTLPVLLLPIVTPASDFEALIVGFFGVLGFELVEIDGFECQVNSVEWVFFWAFG